MTVEGEADNRVLIRKRPIPDQLRRLSSLLADDPSPQDVLVVSVHLEMLADEIAEHGYSIAIE